MKKIYILALISTTYLTPYNSFAANVTLNVTGNHPSSYVASDNASLTAGDNFTVNSATATFGSDLIGNKTKTLTNQTINVTGGTVSGDLIGLNRGYGGTITGVNEINISGGNIQGDVLATKDKNGYNGTDKRTSNIINISGGAIGGNVEGGGGATNNIIKITGGTIEKSSDGHSHDNNYCDGNSGIGNDDNANGSCKSGTIYAGASDPTTKNQSTNGTVTLENMNNSNSFLSTFTEGPDGLSGMIFGSNLTGTSNMNFNNVDGTYLGGFKDFNNVNVDANSDLKLGGNTYHGDNWTVNGTLDTNGKTIHSYKNSTLDLTVGSSGVLTNSFLTDANVNANNSGSIHGIETTKNINLVNSGNMTGKYQGSTVNVNNSGNINTTTSQNTILSSTNAGTLTNTGHIIGNLTLSGQMSINNSTGGNINANIINNQSNLNIANTGIINNSHIINYDDSKTTNINNNAGGQITGNLDLVNGTLNLNNNTGASLTGNNFTNNSGTFNISNSGAMSGNSSLTASNGGIYNFINNASGNVTGDLTINSGLNTFTNNGTFNGLDIINHQPSVVLNNNNTISGTGSIISDNTFTLNNNAGAEITGTQTFKNVNLNNYINGKINNLAMTSDAGTLNISNSGQILGNNSITSANAGVINLINNASGNVTGNLTINSGLNTFTNNGTFNDLNITNHQAGIILNNNNIIGGTGSIISDSIFALNNNSGAVITGTQTFKNVDLNNKAGAYINDLNLTSDAGAVNIINDGTVIGTNSLSSTNSGTIDFQNNSGGVVTGVLNTNSGITNFENNGIFTNLAINNSQNNLTLENNSGANIINTAFSTDNAVFNIKNSGNVSGTNSFDAQNAGIINFDNLAAGSITGTFIVNGGLETLNNEGSISNFALQSNIPEFTIDNSGSFTGDNNFVSSGKVVFNNTGTSSGNLFLNANETVINQNSTTAFTNNIIGNSGTNILTLNNAINSEIASALSGSFNTLNINNSNTDLTSAQVALTNNGNINTAVNIDNDGYISLINNGAISGNISDAGTAPTTSCLTTKVDLVNNATISGDISVMDNKFNFTNNASGLVTSQAIDTRELNLVNYGTIDADSPYTFSVLASMNVENTGTIKGGDMAFKLTGDDVKGTINNSGTIWSHGTTIGMADPLTSCTSCGTGLTLNNTGVLVAVDPVDLTIPHLGSYAINAPTMTVNNTSGGLIGGSMNIESYYQDGNSTWVTFMDRENTNTMSTITAANSIKIDDGATLTIYTNNDVKQYNNNDEFKVVEVTGGQSDIEANLDNFTIRTDSPFANYIMEARGNEGYIVFNHVAPETYSTSTDLATANHTTSILNSHRIYELFVNRDIAQTYNLSSGDNPNFDNSLNFMPIGGYASQDSKDGHAGYNSTYYGGIGYWEHDFNKHIKAGIGFAYMHNNNDYKDVGSSSDVDTYRPFVYANYEFGNFRTDIAAGYARHSIDDNRKYTFNNNLYSAKGKYDANEYSAHLNIGYKVWNQDGEIIQPMAGIYVAKLKTDSYDEKGSGPMNMNVKSDDYNSAKSMLGIKMSKEYTFDSGNTFTPEMHLRWYHEMGDTNGGVTAYFLAQEQLFNTSGIESPKDIGDLAMRFTTSSNSDWDMFAEAYYQFGDKFYNVGGTIGAQYNF